MDCSFHFTAMKQHLCKLLGPMLDRKQPPHCPSGNWGETKVTVWLQQSNTQVAQPLQEEQAIGLQRGRSQEGKYWQLEG